METNNTDNEEQSKQFIETAKALECNEDEKAFDSKLKKILEKKVEPEKR